MFYAAGTYIASQNYGVPKKILEPLFINFYFVKRTRNTRNYCFIRDLKSSDKRY